MKVSKRKFNQGGYYENKTDFVLAPKDYAALGSAYDEQTAKYIAAQDKAAKEKKEKDKAGIQAFENRTKVMDRHNGVLQGAYDIWFDARSAAIADPTSENKQLAQQAYSQYSVIKENAVAITTSYQNEVNSLNKGELDAVLIGNRAQALIDAKEFNEPIPFQVENGRIMVPGSDGQPVEWSQSTFYNESSFGQNGREFIATRKAPGTDYMFAPLSDKFSGELQGSAIIFDMEGDRKKGINEAAVGAQVEQRLRSSLLSEPSAFIDATAQQYGAFNQNVENLTSEGMLKADADFGGTELYSNSKFLTDWKLVYQEPTEATPNGEYQVVFPDVSQAVNAGLGPNEAAAIKNRQDALRYQIKNTADQTLFKLKSQFQPSPTGGGLSLGFGSGSKAKLTPTSFRRVELGVDPGGRQNYGRRLDIGGAQGAIKMNVNNKNAQLTGIVYPEKTPGEDELLKPLYFEIQSKEFKTQARDVAREERSNAKELVESLKDQLDAGGMTGDERRAVKSELEEAIATQKSWSESITAISKLPTKIQISGDRSGVAELFGGTLSDATAGVVDDRFMDIIPSYDEIWGTMQNQYGNETGKINAALGGFDFPDYSPGTPEYEKAMNAGPDAPAPAEGGVGARYN